MVSILLVWRLQMLRKFDALVGKLFQEKETFMTRNYLRFRVEVDVNASLTPGCKISRKNNTLKQPLNSKMWLEFKYERLPRFCIKCCALNHFTNECAYESMMTHKDGVNTFLPIYGECIRANSEIQSLQFLAIWSFSSHSQTSKNKVC